VAAASSENSVSNSSSVILGSPVVVLIFFCMSGVSVDLLACYHYNKDRKVFQFFPEFNMSVHFIFFFHEVEKIEIFFLGFVGSQSQYISVECNQKQQIFKTGNVDSLL
jgi:hypothetical protein